MAEKKVYIGTGRRKTSVAKVRMTAGKGKITINGKDVNEYLPFPALVMDLIQPLEVTGTKDKFDITIDTHGGGFSGQTGATRLAITKALMEFDSPNDPKREDSFRRILKANGFVTRDPRKKERKKYGLKKARKAPQFSKR